MMAAKKRKPKGKPKKKSANAGSSALPDRRALEGALRHLVAGLQSDVGRDATLVRAQDLMYQAFDEADPKRRIQLAQKALALSEDCADAYVLLGEHAGSHKEALDLFQRGVAAGERALGPKAFHEDVGYFWGVLESRPYMRARERLAHALWSAGRRDEAVAHLQDMLRLNPNDNQGLRYTLAGFLLFLGRDGDVANLLKQYSDEGSATWAYNHALLAFRRHGDSAEARQLFKTAVKANKHVVPYLLSEKMPPADSPSYYSPGDESEAVMYVELCLAPWKDTAGAIDWVRKSFPAKKPKTLAPKIPSTAGKALARLPQIEDIWQADFRQMPNWIAIGNNKVRPWAIMVTSRSNDLILASELLEEAPSSGDVWEALAQAMQKPVAGKPHRPKQLQVRRHPAWELHEPLLAQAGIAVHKMDELDQIDLMFQELSEHMAGLPPPGLLDVPGVKPEQVAAFYDAAAAFFEHAPWKKVGFESAIKIECAKYQSGPWYGVLMGQSGLVSGLALYDDLQALQRLLSGHVSDEEGARKTVATTVTFEDESGIPPADLEAAKRHGWKVARPDAYPSIFRKEPGLATRPPLAWELDLMGGCLRVIPDFVTRRRQDDPTKETLTANLAGGPQVFELSWVVGE
jgi:tetratricopeptide (TPR) repeat protein